jgi:putative tryptophan/tyrosine transport system substrate-binding protein
MNRRSFALGLAGLVLLPSTIRVGAQPVNPRPKVAFLSPGAPDDADTVGDRVRTALVALGYVDGKSALLEVRFAHHALERLPALAAELVAARPDVIHTWTTPAARALAAATTTIPIVAAPIGEWGLAELVGNMARPAGNVTGLTLDNREQQEKCLQLLKEAAPSITRVAVLRNPLNPAWRRYPEVLNDAASGLGIELIRAEARNSREIDEAFAAMAAAGADGLFVLAEPTFTNAKPVLKQIVELAIRRGLPSVSDDRRFGPGGGLLSFSSDAMAITQGAALYIHRILTGAKPADLPVVHPTRFDLVVNLNTAKALGLEIPRALLARADEVIE